MIINSKYKQLDKNGFIHTWKLHISVPKCSNNVWLHFNTNVTRQVYANVNFIGNFVWSHCHDKSKI